MLLHVNKYGAPAAVQVCGLYPLAVQPLIREITCAASGAAAIRTADPGVQLYISNHVHTCPMTYRLLEHELFRHLRAYMIQPA
jgi:hypothetical protein